MRHIPTLAGLITAVLSAALLFIVPHTHAQVPPPPISPAPVTNYEYDAQGNPTKVVQAPGAGGLNFATQSTYDALSRLKDTTDAKNGVTRFGYDGLDRTTIVTDPRNLLTQYPRNGLGDATSLISPDTGTATHTFDAARNLLTRTDSRGVLASYSYEPLNRLSSITYTQSGQTPLAYSWEYDQTGLGFSNGIGRLTSTIHPAGSTQYAYDPWGDVLTDVQRVNAAAGANGTQITSTVGYTYDAGGQVTSITYPSGRKLSITYTGGQPTALSLAKDSVNTPTMLIDQIKFLPFGGPRSWTWQMASGPQPHERIFDTSGRIVRYPLCGFVRDLIYDEADRIASYTHYDAVLGATLASNALNQAFAYDELGRVINIVTSSAWWSIGYDANGNRTSVNVSGNASTYTTSSTSNRLESITNPARSFSYDNAGNTTSDSTSYTGTYNLAGRLTTLTKAGTTSTYTYDGLGRRIRKVNSSGAASTIIFVYALNGQLLGEYDQSGNALREYVWLGSTPIAMFTPDTQAGKPPLVYFIHADHIDTPRVVVDRSNNLRWRWMAEPFGTTAPETNPASLGVFTQNLRFPGQYADQESGLSYNFFRDFDESKGGYIQSDPIGLAGGTNTYAYAEDNPLQWIDPMGLVVELRCRPADIAAGIVNHCWLKTDTIEAGMNEQVSCTRAGNDASGFPFVKVVVSDHTCDKATIVTPLPEVNEACVNNELQLGRPLGRFIPVPHVNTCQSFTRSVIDKCSPSEINRPYIGYPNFNPRRKRP